MNKNQINRLNEKQAKTIYNNIKATHNLVNIQQVKGKDLEIVDTDKYTYIMTYSFPCQDLSLAGKGKGMSDTTTRSGMLWEVERILIECSQLSCLPQVLLMENVPQVHGEGNKEDFNKWQLRLEQLGYKNYWQDLIATDYEIPQTRNRCFMVSILGDYNYTFPKPIPLKLKLKDMLEENVDEKYYLSDKMLEYMMSESSGGLSRKEMFERNFKEDKEVAATITTCAGNRASDNIIKIKNATKQGYLEAKEGDGIDLCQPNSETRRGRVQKEAIQTLTTQNNLGVCVKGIATNESKEWQKEPLEEKSRTILANKSNGGVGCIDTNLRIRKLTPRECFRLMGVKDEDYDKIAKNQSDSSLYHLAGDSIVVNVLMAIFKEMI